MKNPIIIITGPTASGKTAVSFDVMPGYNAEAICADSMTIYKGMDIGTDKPTLINSKKQTTKNKDGSYTIKGIKHHLLDRFNPDEECNVAIFKDLVQYEVDKIHRRDSIPFIVGGSLFYIDAFAYDYSLPPVAPNKEIRREFEGKSSEELWEELVELDPDAEWTVDKHNKRRVVRALEVCKITGKPFTSQKSKKKLKNNILYLVVDKDRKELYRKINKRVDEMIDEGFVEETRELYKKYDNNTAMQAAGYKQLVEYIEGKTTLKKAIERTKRVHRNFAKRQLTWLKKNQDAVWVKDSREAKKEIEKFLNR